MFDVCIVFDSKNAASADNAAYTESAPFPADGVYFRCNPSYEYFINYCREQGISAIFATSDDITAPNAVKSYWVFDGTWQRVTEAAEVKVFFDKLTASALPQATQQLLTESSLYHSREIRRIFDDKLATYETLPELSIPTVRISERSVSGIQQAQQKLQELIAAHPHTEDFGSEIIIKDQFGSSGMNIYKVDNVNDVAAIEEIRAVAKNIPYIAQPYIETASSGFLSKTGRVDIRIILADGEFIQSFMREAKDGEYRTNAYQGGHLTYLDLDTVPKEVLAHVPYVLERLPYKGNVFALDFLQSDSGNMYLVEGNSMPGLNWFYPENAQHAKLLMRNMIHLIKERLS